MLNSINHVKQSHGALSSEQIRHDTFSEKNNSLIYLIELNC